jgi:hypothetical protein
VAARMTDAGGPGTAGAVPGARRGGPPAWFLALGAGSLLVAVILVALGSLGIGVRVGEPTATLAPTGQAAELTAAQVVGALARGSFQVQDPLTQYRPGESPALAAVPRRLVQTVLPSDPQGGYIVIYELPTSGEADRVGRDFLAWLGGGPGAIQYPRDTRFVLQRVGSTLVFFPWSPEANPDQRVADVAAALGSVGAPVRP